MQRVPHECPALRIVDGLLHAPLELAVLRGLPHLRSVSINLQCAPELLACDVPGHPIQHISMYIIVVVVMGSLAVCELRAALQNEEPAPVACVHL